MNGITDSPVFLVAVVFLAAAIGAVIGFMLRGWYDEARSDRSDGRAGSSGAGAWPTARSTVLPASRSPRSLPGGAMKERTGVKALTDAVGDGDRPLVLLVDDRLELLALHGSYLHQHGYNVLTAEDGDAALELAMSHRPGLIVLDHSMPGRTGVEVARELKRHPETARIPLVMMTAHSYGAVGGAARDAGFDAFLPKPVDPGRMLRQVEELLAGPPQ